MPRRHSTLTVDSAYCQQYALVVYERVFVGSRRQWTVVDATDTDGEPFFGMQTAWVFSQT